MVSPAGAVTVATTGFAGSPVVAAPPWLITVISYRSAASPCRNAPSTALSAVRFGRPATGVSRLIEADGPAGTPPVTATALVTCGPAVESWVPNPARAPNFSVRTRGGYAWPGCTTSDREQVRVGLSEVSQVHPAPAR